MTPRNHVGRPVQGRDFFDRVQEQRRFWRDLETDNLLLLAPRRVGKTSLMFRLRDTAEDHGFRAVYITVADVLDEAGFVRRLYEHVLRGTDGPTLMDRVTESGMGRFVRSFTPAKVTTGPVAIEFSEGASERWDQLGDALVRALQLKAERSLLLIDELPVFVLALLKVDAERARRFLDWFRALRQRADHVRWVLAGSIGLDTVAALHNLADTINDLEVAELGAFGADAAKDFVAGLCTTHAVGLDQRASTYLVAKVGWPIPFFLQLLFRQVRNLVEDQDAPPTVETIDRAWEELLHPNRRNYFDAWRQRLPKQLGPVLARQAESLLVTVSVSEAVQRSTLSQVLSAHIADPEQREQALTFLLNVLRNDGYLVVEGGRYRFRSPLLQAWWRAFHAA